MEEVGFQVQHADVTLLRISNASVCIDLLSSLSLVLVVRCSQFDSVVKKHSREAAAASLPAASLALTPFGKSEVLRHVFTRSAHHEIDFDI